MLLSEYDNIEIGDLVYSKDNKDFWLYFIHTNDEDEKIYGISEKWGKTGYWSTIINLRQGLFNKTHILQKVKKI